MSTLSTLFPAWDEGHRELAIALNGTPDGDLWTRPNPRLLSVGELAGHVAFWEAVRAEGMGNKPDVAQLRIKSPLVDPGFHYYTHLVDKPYRVEFGNRAGDQGGRPGPRGNQSRSRRDRQGRTLSGMAIGDMGGDHPISDLPRRLPHRTGLLRPASARA